MALHETLNGEHSEVNQSVSLYEPDEEEENDIPELTEDILAKMFANMMANGVWDEAG